MTVPASMLALVSDNLMAVTVVVYSLAMLGYAADFAFGRVGRQRPGGAAGAEQAPVSVGAPAGPAAGGDAGASGPAPPEDSGPGPGAEPPAGISEASEPERGRGRAAAPIGRAAVVATAAGGVAHLGAIVTRALAAGRLPWGNMYEFAAVLTFAAVAVYLVLLARHPVRYLGLFVLIPVVAGLGLAVTVLYAPAGPLVPALQSSWLAIHVTAAVVASGAFTVATAAAAGYLVAERYERRLRDGKTTGLSGLAAKLPDKGVLDRIAYRTIAFGFPVWTFAVVAGAIWAEAAWGRYWGWDPKETWAFITWVVYAGYLHARSTAGWKGRGAAVVALIGFLALVFNFFGVNMWITGLHSYAGLD